MEDAPTSVIPPNNVTYDRDDGTSTPHFYIAGTFCLIALIGIPGNVLVMLSVCLSRSLQSATNAFLTSLSVADLLTCSFLPVQAIALLQEAEGFIVPNWMCVGVAYSSCVCNISSMLHLFIIAVTRCVFLTDNNAMKYAHLRTKRNVSILISIAWVLPCLVYLIPIFAGIRKLGYHDVLRVCLFRNEVNTITRFYIAIVAVTYSLTLISITACHLQIFLSIRKHNQKLIAFATPVERPSNNSSTAVDPRELAPLSSDGRDRRGSSVLDIAREKLKSVSLERRRPSAVSHIGLVLSRELEITKYLIYVVAAFIICVLPMLACLTTAKCYNNYLTYMMILLVFNSCVNPFIYSLKDHTFRAVFGALLRCRLSEIPQRFYWLNRKPSVTLQRYWITSQKS
ncbi:melatonin receptor type 1B-A-like [Diadema setosum]|uniref:melatonin receptor type 1B-A-like n=1 Tax=Diadema setosum TaxID=31175 RepID=UPI003B3B9AFE